MVNSTAIDAEQPCRKSVIRRSERLSFAGLIVINSVAAAVIGCILIALADNTPETLRTVAAWLAPGIAAAAWILGIPQYVWRHRKAL